MSKAMTSTPNNFIGGSGGVWAGMRLSEAMQNGQGLNPLVLRDNSTLQRNEWDLLIDEVTKVGQQRLRAVQDLVDAGLTRSVPNAMGVSTISFEKVNDGGIAVRSMSPLVRGEFDQPEYGEDAVPNYFTHSDFQIDLRKLVASRTRGESIDMTQLDSSTRRVAESIEGAVLNGATDVVVNGMKAWGYTSHPGRVTRVFGTNGAWSAAAKTGANILADVLAMIGDLQAQRFFGPYWLYVPSNTATKLEDDFSSAKGDLTIRQRLLSVDGLVAVRVVDQLAADNIVLVQATSDVVQLADGEGIQPVQWDIMGGLAVSFKVFAIQVPLVKQNTNGKTGLAHMS